MIGLVFLPSKVRRRLSRMPEDAALPPGEVFRCYEEALRAQDNPPLLEAVNTDTVDILSMPKEVWASVVDVLRKHDVEEVLVRVHPDENVRVAVVSDTNDECQGLRIERDTLAHKVGLSVADD